MTLGGTATSALVIAVVLIILLAAPAPTRFAATKTHSGGSSSPSSSSHSSHPSSSSSVTFDKPVNVPLSIESDYGSPLGLGRPLVQIVLGNGQHLTVLVDTGSVGLRIFSNEVDSGPTGGIQATNTNDSITYGDDSTFLGVVATAKLEIGSVPIGTPVPFELVHSVVCRPASSTCPADDTGIEESEEASGDDGIMGVGMDGTYPGDPIPNPLLSLPSPLNSSWSIALQANVNGGRGVLRLGATAPSEPIETLALSRNDSSDSAAGAWNDYPIVCWTLRSVVDDCVPTLFDSGTELTYLQGDSFAGLPSRNDAQDQIVTVSQGIQVQARGSTPEGTSDGSTFWTFRSGTTWSQDLLVLSKDKNDWVNTGVAAFYKFSVTYDENAGTIELSSGL